MVITIESSDLVDSARFHSALARAFGFPDFYGNNVSALVDCLGDLDNPSTEMTKIHLLPGQTMVIRVTHLEDCDDRMDQIRPQLTQLNDAVAFVNLRRLDEKRPPLLALAYAPA